MTRSLSGRRATSLALAALGAALSPAGAGAESPAAPRPTPATRPAMKRLLEEMKRRPERIPLPEPTAEERAAAGDDPQALSYEHRLRALHLPATSPRGYLGFAGTAPSRPGVPPRHPADEPDPTLSLDYGFKTRLFWIASRTNNCQYCLGHQESKLLAVGMTDDDLARLDTDWSGFPAAEQAAFALARRITLAPGDVSDADVAACLAHSTPRQVLEMTLSVAGNNAINRWKEGIGVPQAVGGGSSGWTQTGPDGVHSYLTGTAPRLASVPSVVAVLGPPLAADGLHATAAPATPPDAAAMRAAVAATRGRAARLPLVGEDEARRILGDIAPTGRVPAWMRLLAWFPVAGPRMARALVSTAGPGGLEPLDGALVRWTVARRNRAWYALDLAERDLRAAGLTDADLDDLAGDQARLTAARRAMLAVADALAASPVACTDAQFAEALAATSPATMTRVVHAVAMESLFDRFTAVAGLPPE
jgi:hypothetical protein